jgi:hypothetical protein
MVVNRQMIVGLGLWPEKKMKLEEAAIREIPGADTAQESGAKASDVRRLF